METVFYPKRENWNEIIKRPHLDVTELNATVSGILSHVRNQGDEAVLQYEEQFDHVSLTSLSVSEEEICEALRTVDPELMESLEIAHHNIAAFHQAQRYEGISVETAPGVTCSQRSVPIEKVGLYIPGGTAPLVWARKADNSEDHSRFYIRLTGRTEVAGFPIEHNERIVVPVFGRQQDTRSDGEGGLDK